MIDLQTAPRLDHDDNRALILAVETAEGFPLTFCLEHYHQRRDLRALARDPRQIDAHNLADDPSGPYCDVCGPDPLAAERAAWTAAYLAHERAAYGLDDGTTARHWSRTYPELDFKAAYAVFPREMDDAEIRRRLERDGWPLERTGCQCDYDGRDCCGQWFSDGARIDRATIEDTPTPDRPAGYRLRPRRGPTVAYVTWGRCL